MATDEKPSRNEEEYFARLNAELIKERRASLDAARAQTDRKAHYMKCPKDGYDLSSSEFHGVQIETCTHCSGIWLDAGELQMLAHEQRQALMTRVISEALSVFRGSDRKAGPGK